MELFETEQQQETAVLVGVHTGQGGVEDTTDETLDELELLAQTAGAVVEGRFMQNRPSPDNAAYVGEGKAEEVRRFCEDNNIDLVIVDDELSGIQIRNLEELTDTRVIDRSALIMDIFAQRAQTLEGKLQVELARLQYSLPRLAGSSARLSRQGGGASGGIGARRGAGESKLETDRRHIRRRIDAIRDQLKEVEKNRNLQRHQREKSGIGQVALVGYTNAGKSTLMNRLTDAGVLVEDKLFATLDPTARKLMLPDGAQAVLIDTVGFIRKLPHHLIKAFSSTLEETLQADVLLHVVDVSSPHLFDNIQVVESLLDELGAGDKPVITVYNKYDLLDTPMPLPGRSGPGVNISAKTGQGIDVLLDTICKNMPEQRRRVQVLIPYADGSILSRVYGIASIHSQEHTQSGTLLDITVDQKGLHLVRDYIV